MPHIKFEGLKKESVKRISQSLGSELAKVMDCPQDWISFFFVETAIFCCGEEAKDTVFIHVEWFDRGSEIKSAVSKIITDEILQSGKAEFHGIETVDVIFVDMKKSDFFENGEHF